MMRPLLPGLILLTTLSVHGAAYAGVVHGGESIHLRVAGHRESGRALKAESDGWRLSVRAPETVVELNDVTANAAPDKWVVPVSRGAALLDPTRFRAGHAYRVEIRRGTTTLETGFVYLAPPSGRARERVVFEERETSSNDEIAVVPKSAL